MVLFVQKFQAQKGYRENMSFRSWRLHLGVPRPLHGEPGRALLADHSAGYFLGRPAAKVGEGLELDAALVPRVMVGHDHLAVVVDPQLAEDEVVDDGGDLAPRVVVAALGEEHVLDPQRLELEVLPPEPGARPVLLPGLPLARGRLAVLRGYIM